MRGPGLTLISVPQHQFEQMDEDGREQDVTANMCDYCMTLYVTRNPPKRPLSPFIFFSQEQRKVLKMINQKWSTKQVMKHLQKTWRSMSEA